MNKALLEIKDLEIIYKTDIETVHAVNRISFSINQGETLGIVGETGAGKTTTALSILRLLPEKTGKILSGEINFRGRDLLKNSENEMRLIRGKNISMIFQDPMTALNPVLTIGDQIGEALELHNHDNKSKKQIETKVDEILELVGITKTRKNEYPHQFSGGMKQRVVIAIALACEPELIIADEPTTALDVTIQAQILSMMKELRQRLNTSMIMITHDFGIVANICDRVAVMYAGEIIEYGLIENIFEEIKHHPYTEGLFGAIPNIRQETRRLNQIDGLMPDPTNLSEGCLFYQRCKHRMSICQDKRPKLTGDINHSIACHLFNPEFNH